MQTGCELAHIDELKTDFETFPRSGVDNRIPLTLLRASLSDALGGVAAANSLLGVLALRDRCAFYDFGINFVAVVFALPLEFPTCVRFCVCRLGYHFLQVKSYSRHFCHRSETVGFDVYVAIASHPKFTSDHPRLTHKAFFLLKVRFMFYPNCFIPLSHILCSRLFLLLGVFNSEDFRNLLDRIVLFPLCAFVLSLQSLVSSEKGISDGNPIQVCPIQPTQPKPPNPNLT